MSCSVKVSGKIMLAGEYSVLMDKPALAAAVNLKLQADFFPPPPSIKATRASGVVVDSQLWSRPERVFATDTPSKQPLLAAVQAAMALHPQVSGKLTVDGKLQPQYGLGSSSALRLAVALALNPKTAALTPDKSAGQDHIWEAGTTAWEWQSHSQGQASGYDIATQCHGGVVEFCKAGTASLREATRDAGGGVARDFFDRYVRVYVGGKGAATGKVTASTLQWLQQSEERLARLHEINEHLVATFLRCWQSPDGDRALPFGDLADGFAAHSQLFRQSESYPRTIMDSIARQPGYGKTWLLKPTGAGGEDALLCVTGKPQDDTPDRWLQRLGWQHLPLKVSPQGVSW